MVAGEKLGSGIARTAYVNLLDSTKVVKIEDVSCSFQNVLEWETWQRIQHTKHARWFAPCFSISPCGMVLIQGRTTTPSRYPPKVPAFLTDLKRSNYGSYKGRFVCHDYGMTLLMENGMTTRMRKASWWDL